MKPIISSSWNLVSNFEYDKQIEIFVDRFIPTPIPENTIRIIIIQESYNSQWLIKELNNHKNYYTYIFTYLQKVLDTNDKARLFLGVCTWIKNYNFPIKKYGVSTVVGGKNEPNLEGHRLRHELWGRQWEILLLKDFYLSSTMKYANADYSNKLVLGDDKSVMFNNQFHIAIENTSIRNMFTEKLIDCFQTKTIPIYYGCKNLGDYFNLDGVFLAGSVNEIINICNNITTETYPARLYAVEDNYQRSMNYISHTQLLDGKLDELLNKKT